MNQIHSAAIDAVEKTANAAAKPMIVMENVEKWYGPYQALHDIVSASYFSGQESWAALGYPGPRAI